VALINQFVNIVNAMLSAIRFIRSTYTQRFIYNSLCRRSMTDAGKDFVMTSNCSVVIDLREELHSSVKVS
jgi:hypothetical protein